MLTDKYENQHLSVKLNFKVTVVQNYVTNGNQLHFKCTLQFHNWLIVESHVTQLHVLTDYRTTLGGMPRFFFCGWF